MLTAIHGARLGAGSHGLIQANWLVIVPVAYTAYEIHDLVLLMAQKALSQARQRAWGRK